VAYKVFVDGQEGTTGLQINQLLARRSDIEVLRIDADKRKDPMERARLLNAADVAFLCLPDAAAREAVALVTNPQTCVIDASTAHRTAPGWIYGLPELVAGQREAIRGAIRIANPGCHATAFILLVRPLVDAGLLPADYPLSTTSITGYSGGGRKMIDEYEIGSDPKLSSPRQYAFTLAHKHLPEMREQSRLAASPVFAPVVADFYKGLAVSIGLQTRSLAAGATPEKLHEALDRHYAGERFVTVRPLNDPAILAGGYFDVQACNDSNRAELFVFGHAEQAMLVCRLDNLGKGASGAAVQAMNLRLGVDEGLGLEEGAALRAAA
jgi:N-acetyl-gamma-glutamyl-phosphate reductase